MSSKSKGRATEKKKKNKKKGGGGALRFDQESSPVLADDLSGGLASPRSKLKPRAQPQQSNLQAPDLYLGAADSQGGTFSPSLVRQGLILFYDRHDPARDQLDDVIDLLLDYASRGGLKLLNTKLKAKYGEDLSDVDVIDLDELFPEDADDFDNELPPPSPDEEEEDEPPPLPDFSDRTLRRLKKMSTERHSLDTRTTRASSDGLPPPPPLPPPLEEDDSAPPPPPPLPPMEDDDDEQGKSKSKRKSFFKSARKSIFGSK